MTSGPVEESGGRLLESDIGVIYLLLNEARYRTLARLFGVSREQANLATLVFVAVLAEAARARAERLRGLPGPSRSDIAVGGAAVRELGYMVAGATLRETPMFSTLVAIAVVWKLSGPVVTRSLHGVRTGSHRFWHGFHHRYGYLVHRD
jgi:hypothetical protein